MTDTRDFSQWLTWRETRAESERKDGSAPHRRAQTDADITAEVNLLPACNEEDLGSIELLVHALIPLNRRPRRRAEDARYLLQWLIVHVIGSETDENKTLSHLREMVEDIELTLHAMKVKPSRYMPDGQAPDRLARDKDGQLIRDIHPDCIRAALTIEALKWNERAETMSILEDALARFHGVCRAAA
ncbi:MAG: hypothetical protein ACYDD1_02725 [Caulobacteraceae bacterium]